MRLSNKYFIVHSSPLQHNVLEQPFWFLLNILQITGLIKDD